MVASSKWPLHLSSFVSTFKQSWLRREEILTLLRSRIGRLMKSAYRQAGPYPPDSCQQDCDLPKSPLNNRQLLPSVGTISIWKLIFVCIEPDKKTRNMNLLRRCLPATGSDFCPESSSGFCRSFYSFIFIPGASAHSSPIIR